MTDYIKREAAFGVIRAENLAVHFDSVKDGLYNRVKRAQERYIASIPAADVAPVVHGRWVTPTVINGRSFRVPHCSACDGVPCGVDENTKFCPNCGAKMDGESNG